MRHNRFLTFLAVLLCFPGMALASVQRAQLSCDGGNKLFIDEEIWQPLPPLVTAKRLAKKNLFLYYSSMGGVVTLAQERANSFEKLANELSQNGAQLSVIIHQNCSSSCTMVLANLNRLAGQKKISLYVLDETSVGFHAAHDFVTKTIDDSITGLMKQTLLDNGVSRSWLEANRAMFESVEFTSFAAMDAPLQDSGILSNARVLSLEELRELTPANCR